MTQLQFLLDWDKYAVVVAFCTSLLLPFALMPIWKWWRDSLGVNLQLKDFAISGALVGPFLYYLFGINPEELWFRYLQCVCITLIPIILVWRFQIVLREQRDGARSSKRRHQVDGGKDASTGRK